mmetsp:Transcript_6851/g.10405  ORF Transcript_6851/g.10405 Transcript_6851/m.10405 type:complete len:197 (+) Transcript_6851:150-740(+)
MIILVKLSIFLLATVASEAQYVRGTRSRAWDPDFTTNVNSALNMAAGGTTGGDGKGVTSIFGTGRGDGTSYSLGNGAGNAFGATNGAGLGSALERGEGKHPSRAWNEEKVTTEANTWSASGGAYFGQGQSEQVSNGLKFQAAADSSGYGFGAGTSALTGVFSANHPTQTNEQEFEKLGEAFTPSVRGGWIEMEGGN